MYFLTKTYAQLATRSPNSEIKGLLLPSSGFKFLVVSLVGDRVMGWATLLMTIDLNIISETFNSTVSALIHQKEFLGFVIEDGFRETKIPGESRIPEGTYEVVRRYEGRHYDRYKVKYKHKHTFMLKGVPNFSYIMIHIGNDSNDTEGCLLMNYSVRYNAYENTFIGAFSEDAYKDLYKFLTNVFDNGESVFIKINRK